MGLPLAMAAKTWPTPAARDFKGENGADHLENGTGRRHMDQLPNFVRFQWSTPRSHEVGQYTRDNGDPDKQRPSLTGQAFSLPDREISTPGDGSSTIRRTLNPLFVEWLMGWPPGWTFLALMPETPSDGTRRGSSGCACSATALSRFRADMRSALCSLGLPQEAAPPQLALFG